MPSHVAVALDDVSIHELREKLSSVCAECDSYLIKLLEMAQNIYSYIIKRLSH